MLYITYNTDQHDGFCGQLQRVIGTMALAEKNNVTFVHSPFVHMEHIPEPKTHYLEKIEEYLQIKHHYAPVTQMQYAEIVNIKHLDDSIISYYKSLSHDRNVLLMNMHSHPTFDKSPDEYNFILPKLRTIKQSLPLIYYEHPDKQQNIAIHIRRGDVTPDAHPTRYTPVAYFKKIVEDLLSINPNANICIFTELAYQNRHEFDFFVSSVQSVNPIKIVANQDILVTFEHLIMADILVTSKSSFSYVASLYNKNRVLYTEFWHSPMSHWIKL